MVKPTIKLMIDHIFVGRETTLLELKLESTISKIWE